MRRCDLFYKSAMEREKWSKDDLCDPPTEPREGIHILIDELIGRDWYVAIPENDDQVITAAIYNIIRRYVDEPKKKENIWICIVLLCTMINILLFFVH